MNIKLPNKYKRKLIILEKEPNADLFPLYLAVEAICNGMKQYTTEPFPLYCLKLSDKEIWYLCSMDDFIRIANKFTDKIARNPNLIKEYEKFILSFHEKADKLKKDIDNCKNLDNESLYRTYNKAITYILELYKIGIPLAMVDFGEYKKVSSYVKSKLKEKLNDEKKVEEIYLNIVSPDKETSLKKSEKALKEITKDVIKNPSLKKIFSDNDKYEVIKRKLKGTELDKKIKSFLDRFCWVSYVYRGPAMKYRDVLERIKATLSLSMQKKDTDSSSSEESKRDKIIKNLGLDKDNKFISYVRLLKTVAWLKPERRFIQSKLYYYMEPLFKEICRRINFPYSLVRWTFHWEIERALLNNEKLDMKEIKKRKDSLYIVYKNKHYLITNKEEIKKFLDTYLTKLEKKEKKEFKGAPAYQGGILLGKAKIVNTVDDMKKMEKLEVLISHATNPNLVPAMLKAVAIVTDMGGVTSHAAIVSREFRIPCVVGTGDITQHIKDGDYLEVDTNKGIVRKITKEEYERKIKKLGRKKKKVKVSRIPKETIEIELKPDLIAWFKDISKKDILLVGGKGANLGEMFKSFPIPNGFCITVNAYKKFLKENNLEDKIFPLLAELDIENTKELEKVSKNIKDLIMGGKISKEIKEEIIKNYKRLKEKFVAVRSSATAEDLPTASFAGQQVTFLNVKGERALLVAVKKCWASLFTARAIYYRVVNGFKHEKVLISVVVQEMVNSAKAGVMFSVNPVSKDKNEVVIESSYGLGEAVVSGLVNPDAYVVDKKSLKIKEKKINEKKIAIVRSSDGRNKKIKLSKSKANSQCLTEKEVRELAKLAIKIEKHYKKPQDIEWAIDRKGKVYILQSRAITTL